MVAEEEKITVELKKSQSVILCEPVIFVYETVKTSKQFSLS